jgi:hypothetical protein
MAKLVLDIEPEIKDKLDKLVREKNIDLSKITEDFFRSLTVAEDELGKIRKEPKDYPEWIQKIILSKEPTLDFDHKAEYRKYIEDKYGS